jgi:hypothetical protein
LQFIDVFLIKAAYLFNSFVLTVLIVLPLRMLSGKCTILFSNPLVNINYYMRHHRLILLVLAVFSICTHAFTKEVPVSAAIQVAENFINKGRDSQDSSASILHVITEFYGNIAVLYVCNSATGFVLVAADDRVYPILGYSYNGPYDPEKKNEAFTWWVSQYAQQIHQLIDENYSASQEIANEWHQYLSGSQTNRSKGNSVAPLLTTKWNQGNHYNALCPAAPGGPGGHAMVGCVAVAMGQIMKYHEYPVQGIGSSSYTHSTYGVQSANYGSTTYNWTNMPNILSGPNTDVATLLYHIGVSVKMNYGPSGSGAPALSAFNPIKQYFGYSNSTEVDFKVGYSDSLWEKRLRLELDDGRPIYYEGVDATAGGHAFVCDGYDENGFFHFNWGWGGTADGYFRVTNLNPLGNLLAVNNYIILVRPQPLAPFCVGTKLITAPHDTISDGSGKYFYQNKSTCSWNIQPPGATVIFLNFIEFSLENGYDFLKIYDGANASAPLIGSFTGSALPPLIVSSGGQLHLRFTTDDYIGDEGWTLVYSASATGVPTEKRLTLSLFPNPTSGVIAIQFAGEQIGPMDITVRNLLGQTIQTVQLNKQQLIDVHFLYLSSEPRGVYFVEVISDGSRWIEKIILQ